MDILSHGCDIGNSTIKMVLLNHNNKILYRDCVPHSGDMTEAFASEFDPIYSANKVKMLVEGVKVLEPECGSIIEIGGESSYFTTGI